MISRRAFLAGLGAAPFLRPAYAATPFSHDAVIEAARALAAADYAPRASVPQDWRDLSYDDYRKFRFRLERALWAGTERSYEVDFFLPGLYFPRPVQVFAVTDGQAEKIGFDLSKFQRGEGAPDLSIDDTLGWSGLRLRTDLGNPALKEEFCVFQGASYFRAIGKGQAYGLSARGLALRTGDPEGEEFPEFIDFWVEAPDAGQRHVVVHALMDSPSVAGAYRFVVTPGDSTVMDVTATLFPRTELDHVGIAPLTSMFFFDETNRGRFEDFRPAIHDSDGLLIVNGAGEVLWRPLANPRQLQVSAFVDDNPRGFGLMQRERDFEDFADLEALYHARPSLWVEPIGDWGKGSVTLVEIPTDKEIYDNIVAYWRPATPPPAGEALTLSYRLTWGPEAPVSTGLAQVLNTRMGPDPFVPGIIATVDFAAHPLLDGDPEDVEIRLYSGTAEVSVTKVQRNPATGGLRLAFRFDPGEAEFVELRAQLRRDGVPATEVWLYRWTA